MSALLIFLTALRHCFLTACVAFFDLDRLLFLMVRPRAALAAENLFLRTTGGFPGRACFAGILSSTSP